MLRTIKHFTLKGAPRPQKMSFFVRLFWNATIRGGVAPIDGFPPDAANVAGTVTLQQDNVRECAGGHLRLRCGAVQCNNGKDKKRSYVASARHSTSMPMIPPTNRCHGGGSSSSVTSMNTSGGVLSSRNERLAESPHELKLSMRSLPKRSFCTQEKLLRELMRTEEPTSQRSRRSSSTTGRVRGGTSAR